MFNLTKVIIKSISITHPLNVEGRITISPPCFVYVDSILLTLTGRYSKRGLLVLNRVNNNREIFEVSSLIKIQSTLRTGLGQYLTVTGDSSVLT